MKSFECLCKKKKEEIIWQVLNCKAWIKMKNLFYISEKESYVYVENNGPRPRPLFLFAFIQFTQLDMWLLME